MKGLNFKLILGLLILFSISSCENEELKDNNSLLGLWQINTEQHLYIINNDTIENSISADGRYFELQKDSVLIIYWIYPTYSDKSIWYKKGIDSLYVFFDGATSKVIYKYKYNLISDTIMIWEKSVYTVDDVLQKEVYEVIKK